MRAYIMAQRLLGKSIGFVPTMGALHKGHVSLIAFSKEKVDITVSSIFVNPTQFNSIEDLAKYPRTIEADIIMLETSGCDVLFYPGAAEMYVNGFSTESYNWGSITHSLEGEYRPGHFDGVITIVSKLFDAVNPHHAYFGQKDFQQCAVIKEMVKRFQLDITIHVCPISREIDGLAMSSRNVRMNEQERQDALLIYKALLFIKQNYQIKSIEFVLEEAKQILIKSDLMKPEYISIVNAQTLEPLTELLPNQQYVALITTWCGNVRLIDNMLLND